MTDGLQVLTNIKCLNDEKFCKEELNKEIAERDDYESPEYIELLNNLSSTEERIRMEGGYDTDIKINRILSTKIMFYYHN